MLLEARRGYGRDTQKVLGGSKAIQVRPGQVMQCCSGMALLGATHSIAGQGMRCQVSEVRLRAWLGSLLGLFCMVCKEVWFSKMKVSVGRYIHKHKIKCKDTWKERGSLCQESMLFMYLEDVDKNNGSQVQTLTPNMSPISSAKLKTHKVYLRQANWRLSGYLWKLLINSWLGYPDVKKLVLIRKFQIRILWISTAANMLDFL